MSHVPPSVIVKEFFAVDPARAVMQVMVGRDYVECMLNPPLSAVPPALPFGVTTRLAKSGMPNDKRVFIEIQGTNFNADFDLADFNVMTSTADPHFPDRADVSRVILATKHGPGGHGLSVTVSSRFNELIQRLVLHQQDFDVALKEVYP